ncbi:MAG: molybdenum cofactor biosynthesis protein MoaE [Gammaproteobacteria bacterium]
MRTAIRHGPFDPYAELARFERERIAAGSCGAAAVFIGTLRDFNDGAGVQRMTLDHYPGMTERHLERIAAEAIERWPLAECLIIHRVGEIALGEAIVLCAAWSAHRSAAFDACRFLIEDLKQRAPFWKKETRADGERWVEHNTPP